MVVKEESKELVQTNHNATVTRPKRQNRREIFAKSKKNLGEIRKFNTR